MVKEFGLYSVESKGATEVADLGQEKGVTWSQGQEDHPRTWPSFPFCPTSPWSRQDGAVARRVLRLEWVAGVMFKIFPSQHGMVID